MGYSLIVLYYLHVILPRPLPKRETQENVFLLPTQQKVVYYVLQEDHLVLFMVRSFINSLCIMLYSHV